MTRIRAGLLSGIAILFLAVAAILTVGQASAQSPTPVSDATPATTAETTPTATPTPTVETTPTVTPTATAEPTAKIEVVVPKEFVPGQPLIKGGELLALLVVVLVGGMGLLALMVLVRGGGSGNAQEGMFRCQIEGMILMMVVVAVILLGVTEKIGQEGLVSVLAAITGYAVGRAVSETGK